MEMEEATAADASAEAAALAAHTRIESTQDVDGGRESGTLPTELERRTTRIQMSKVHRKRTLRSLPVRKRSKRWPHSWEARELILDETAGELAWRQPDWRTYNVSSRRQFVMLAAIQSVAVLNAQYNSFGVAVHKRVHDFRAPCTRHTWPLRMLACPRLVGH